MVKEIDEKNYLEERGHDEILERNFFPDENFINARIMPEKSMFIEESNTKRSSNDFNDSSLHHIAFTTNKNYSMMIKLIDGSLNGIGNWIAQYDDSTYNHDGVSSIPTIASIANRIAKEKGEILDSKQRIAYETICSTFLLGLIHDGDDYSTSLGNYFANAVASITSSNDGSFPHNISCESSLSSKETKTECDSNEGQCSQMSISSTENKSGCSSSVSSAQSQFTHHSNEDYKNLVMDKLYALGAKEQLMMFLTGSAGAGKTTAVKLAQKFCFEFCHAVSIFWSDRTFLFTAYTGSAASCFGGITICKAAFLNKTKATLSQDEIDEWKDVRILVIDEISFMKNSDMIQLDRRLKQCSGDRLKPYGGYSIIFAGNFRQLEPSGATPQQLLFSIESSPHWENMLNAVIILESQHRFKEDKKYGELLQRMWLNDLTKKDRKWLNERVVGSDLVPNLPDEFPGLDAVFACPTNIERNSISAGNFKRHVLNTHPSVHSLDEPPNHTLIIEANIRSSKGRKANIGGAIKSRMLTSCGDAKVLTASKRHVDPALCLYVGAHHCN